MKKKILLLSAISALAVGAISATLAAGSDSLTGSASEVEYSITIEAEDITSATSFTDGSFVAYTDQLHNPVSFSFGSAKLNGEFVEFKGQNDGYFGNSESNAIYAIKQVEFFFMEDNPCYTAKIKWGWKDGGVVDYSYSTNIYVTDPDGYRFVFDEDYPDFFQIIDDDEDNESLFIKKMIITYGEECKTQHSSGDPYRVVGKLKYKKYGDHWAVMGFADNEDKLTDLTFASEIEGLPVTVIKNHAFYYEGGIESVDFSGSNITTIERYAFYVNGSLTSVDFRNSDVVELDEYCFSSCYNLADVYGLDLIEVFEDSCLAGTAITSVTLGDNLHQLNQSPFYACNSLLSVTFSDLCDPYVSQGAFNWCESLETVHIGSLMTSLPSFYMAPIKTFTVGPDAVHYMVDGDGVLYSKYDDHGGYYLNRIPRGTELTNYVMPEFVQYCVSGFAQGCASLESVTINAVITGLDSECFEGCTGLKTVTFASGSHVGYISSEVFAGCSSLLSITLPDSVHSISADVFKNCTSLTSFTLPHDIGSIAPAFEGCINITTIYYDGTVEEWNTRAIYKYDKWYNGISATVLTCTDDTINIEDAD